MTNILQSLDRYYFGHAKILFEWQISHKFCAWLSHTNTHFFEGYMHPKRDIQFQNYYRRLEKTLLISK